MEFAEVISISKIDNVVLYNSGLVDDNRPIEGTLCVTGHHLILSSRSCSNRSDSAPQELCILQQSIDHIERKPKLNHGNNSTSTTSVNSANISDMSTTQTLTQTPNNNNISNSLLVLKCKNFRILQFEIKSSEQFVLLYKTLERLMNIYEYNNECNTKLLYPFYYRLPIHSMRTPAKEFAETNTTTTYENGHQLYSNVEMEYKHLFTPDEQQGKAVEWRITDVNKYYNVCRTYSKLLIVPRCIDDATLVESSRYREQGRIPLISYKHEVNGAVLLRAGQPLVGPANKRCRSDERLLNAVLQMNNKPGYIFDTRSLSCANQCKSRGGGYELDVNYPQWKRIHKIGLDKINSNTTLNDSLAKLIEACNDVNCSVDKWLSKLNNSDWLHHILLVLNTACIVAQSLHHDNVNVLVHGTYGLDTTLLVTSLAQIILNPDCRTIRGLQALIEREWLQTGYPFQLRHIHSCYHPSPNTSTSASSAASVSSSAYSDNNQQQPTFLLFLDCVHQLHHQFPCSFEFTTSFLITLFEHSYFSQYGTFVGNNEQERVQLNVYQGTTSLWTHVNRPEVITTYLNAMYEPNHTPIWPSIAPISIVLWSDLYLRFVINLQPTHNSYKTIQSIQQHHLQLRFQVLQLRKQLIELQKIYDSLSLSIN